MTSAWLSARDLAASGLRLFCFPHAGSGAAGFYRWKRLLPASVAVCPVLLPGREARLREPLLPAIESVVEALSTEGVAYTDTPYAVFGHSMGALLAYEWVRRLAAAGLPQPVCLFCSGRNAPSMQSGHTGLHRLPDAAFVEELKARYGGEPETLLGDTELRALFLPILRNDLQLVESYAHVPGERLRCALRAMAGSDDRSVYDEGLARWGELTTGSFAARTLAGDHFYTFGQGEAELLRFIAETLAELSSAAPSTNPEGA